MACALAVASPLAAQTLATTLPEAGGRFQVPVVSFRDMPFRSVVRQQYDFSCGSAALATLLRYQYGLSIDEATAFKAMWADGDQASIRKAGFSLLDMKRYLATLGLTADGYKAPLDLLAKTGIPAIVVINVEGYKHFVVVKGLDARTVLIGDPAIGIHLYSQAQFAKIWDGAMFVVHEGAKTAPVFNSPTEWGYVSYAPIPAAIASEQSIATLTRNFAPIFQITPIIRLPVVSSGQ